jgi:hypothetical protein
MCIGIEYFIDDKPVRVDLSMRDRRVPVRMKGGGFKLFPLGPGELVEVDKSPGNFNSWPADNYVTLQMLYNPDGLWKRWRSAVHPVKIPAARFYHQDALGYPKAHDLKPGQFLQGALVKKSPLSARVYFVIVLAPNCTVQDGRWWPRVVE